MDRVLAGLGDETPAAEPPRRAESNVIPIAPQRRRRAAQLLVAAAAIVLGGVAVSQYWHPSSSSSSASADSAGTDQPENSLNSGGLKSGDTGNDSKLDAPQTPNSSEDLTKARVRHDRLVVRPQHFSDDALAGRRLLSKKSAPTAGEFASLSDCGVDAGHHAELLAALYQGAPAALLYRHAQDSAQIVDLFVCGSTTPIRTTTLPVP
jgi:hypothetical protein